MTHRLPLFWLVAGILDFPFWLALAGRPEFLLTQRFLILLLHAASSCLLFFAFPRGGGWLHPARLGARTAALWNFFLPLVGWGLAGIMFLREKSYRCQAAMEEEMEGTIQPRREAFAFAPDPARERILRELDLIPLTDILAGDDLQLKRGAVAQLAELKTPEAVALLQKYRTDPNPDIRFFVTTALAKIKKEFEENLQGAKEEMEKEIGSLKSRLYLARTYLQYARSGLLDKTTALSYEAWALQHLQFAVLDEQAPEEAIWILIDLYQDRGDWSNVLQLLDLLEKRNLGAAEKIIQARAGACYALGSYPQLVAVLQKAKGVGVLKLRAIADWWTG